MKGILNFVRSTAVCGAHRDPGRLHRLHSHIHSQDGATRGRWNGYAALSRFSPESAVSEIGGGVELCRELFRGMNNRNNYDRLGTITTFEFFLCSARSFTHEVDWLGHAALDRLPPELAICRIRGR